MTNDDYKAECRADGIYVVTARSDIRIGRIEPVSGKWKGFDERTVMDDHKVETGICSTPEDTFEALLSAGGWHKSPAPA